MDDAEIAGIVSRVMSRLQADHPEALRVENADGVFSRMEDAVAAAEEAQKAWVALPLRERAAIIEAMRAVIREHTRELAELSVSETGMGNPEHKVNKITLVVDKTPGIEDIPHRSFSGDFGVTLEEYTPFGVVGSITPSTNPPETVTSNAICALAAGNSIVFNFHPGAKRVSTRALTLMNRAILTSGGPRNMLTTVANPTLETGQAIFDSPKVKLLVVTGGGSVVKAATRSGKRCLAAGPGNPPVIVDDSADIERAGRKVVQGASLDNNIVCIAEKEVFVVESVAEEFKAALRKNGAVEIGSYQLDRLLKTCLEGYEGPHGPRCRPRRDSVGRFASVLAKRIDLTIPSSTPILFCDVGSNKNHPLVQTEQLMPILPIVRMPNFEAAMEAALEAEHGYSHTAMIHSRNLEHVTIFGRRANCSIFVVNGSCYNGLGLEGEGPTAWSITTPTGEGCTTPRDFARKRRMAIVDALRIY
ncbi:MAG: aldehyde dehydrogenase family protein [Candidatus Hydrogenedentota bacterium]|nr:MAG: aldehyde dehydrogenase family protein [Candidatus Hydrogenedentota bacterium]